MDEIQRMKDAGVVTPKMNTAWTSLSYSMADREQNDVIADDYDKIRGRTTGEAFTAAMTWLGW